MKLPLLYAIADAATLSRHDLALVRFAEELRAAGVTLVQYRDKHATDEAMVENADAIGKVFAGSETNLLIDDRLDVALLAGWSGVHVGQQDTPPDEARIILGDGRVIGVSTHDEAQVIAADRSQADYIAVGPIFPTATKADAAHVVGLNFVRRARELTRKPIVAIGGITRQNARSVIEAGADSVAVISGLIVAGEPVAKVARDFLALLR